jgi:hypothetical protein
MKTRLVYARLVFRVLYELARYDVLHATCGFGMIRDGLAKTSPKGASADPVRQRAICDAVLLATCLYWKPVPCLQRSVCAALRRTAPRAGAPEAQRRAGPRRHFVHARGRRTGRLHRPERDPGHSATVLVALAANGGTPSATTAGNVISVPPPATALIAPPTAAARNTRK